MGVESVNAQSSSYGAAFKNMDRPVILKTNAEIIAFIGGKMGKNMVLREDLCTISSNNNDLFRNRNTTYEIPNREKGSVFLDFHFLISDETSSLKGSLEDAEDVDYYNFTIPYDRTLQNGFTTEIRMDLSEGSNYTLTLYDEYGNQIGRAEWDSENRKRVRIPNWDTETSRYCIKVENERGEEVSPDDYYKISFHTYKSGGTERTDAISEAYCEWENAVSLGKENVQEYLDRYNALLQEAEANYTREVEQLHRKQYENLPEEKQYKGDCSVGELLQDMAEGKSLSEAELEYVKIFASLKNFENAQQKAQLKGEFSEEFIREIENMDISQEDIEGMCVKIESDGTIDVEGIEDEAIREQVERLVEKKYSDQMYRYYIGIADSVGDLPANVYEYATQVQEVQRWLKQAAGEDIALENLYFAPKGKIGGLPENVSKLLYETKNNAKIEQIRDMLTDITSNISRHKDIGIPDFTSELQFQNGAFSVVDSGFAVDMEKLADQMTPKFPNGKYTNVYEYNFEKVL